MIGFGSTEQKYEEQVETLLRGRVEEMHAESSSQSGFSDELIAAFKKYVDGLAVDSRRASDGYKDAEQYPDRYSSFHAYVLGDCNYIVVILSFMHINRRHAFSPDGWAGMQSERAVVIDEWEAGRKKRREAAEKAGKEAA
jgi:hypothetical protein